MLDIHTFMRSQLQRKCESSTQMPHNLATKRTSLRRKCKSSSKMVRSLMKLEQDIAKKEQSMKASLKQFRRSRKILRQCLADVVKQEEKLKNHTAELKIAKHDLEKTAEEILSHQQFKGKEEITLNVAATIASDETAVAERQIKHIHKELDSMSPVVEDSRDHPYGWLRCYDRVMIPNLNSNRMGNSSLPTTTENTCTICTEKEADCVIVDCGHQSMCKECTSQYVNEFEYEMCPICRAVITETIASEPI